MGFMHLTRLYNFNEAQLYKQFMSGFIKPFESKNCRDGSLHNAMNTIEFSVIAHDRCFTLVLFRYNFHLDLKCCR